MSIVEDRSGIGSNRPPIRDLMADTNESLPRYLDDENADLLTRRDELIEAALRAPETVDDEDTAQNVGDFIKQLAACVKEANTRRVGNKEPALAAGRLVDGFFRAIADPLEKAKTNITSRLTSYQRKKAEEERRAREAEAERQRLEAERAQREAKERARSLQTTSDLDDAIAAEEAAKQAAADAAVAQKAAEANAAERSRTHGDLGSVSSLRTWWDFTSLDRDSLDLEALRQHLPQDGLEKAVRAFIKSGGRELRGVRIFENTKTVVR